MGRPESGTDAVWTVCTDVDLAVQVVDLVPVGSVSMGSTDTVSGVIFPSELVLGLPNSALSGVAGGNGSVGVPNDGLGEEAGEGVLDGKGDVCGREIVVISSRIRSTTGSPLSTEFFDAVVSRVSTCRTS